MDMFGHICIVLVTTCLIHGCLGGDVYLNNTVGQPWPMPFSFKATDAVVPVNSENFKFLDTGSTQCDVLESAFKRYDQIIFGRSGRSLKFRPRRDFEGEIDTLQVTSSGGCTQKLGLESDESYKLSISAGKALITANESWGVLRGLETFSQLVYRRLDGQLVVNVTEIEDKPRFKHRAVLLDTSRHYLRKKYILENLDAMAANKMNVFHWHIVDDESFPFVSLSFPNLSDEGAYPPVENHVYTPEDVKDIIDYAYERGIRVMPEFDSPGHSLSWGSQPNLLTTCYYNGKPTGYYGPINPILNSTYDFMAKLLAEVAQRFPDDYIFLGGDEVSFSCWMSNADITAFMKKTGFNSDYGKLEQYYMQKILNIVSGLKKNYVIWQEVLDNGAKVDPNTVVGVWKSGLDEVARLTKLGYKTIYSKPWYINYITDPYFHTQWQDYYKVEPLNFTGTDQQKSLVMGGEATMWAEFVDGSNVINRLWPNAAAVAERLWSPKELADPVAAAARFGENRCRMVKRGIHAKPARGPTFCEWEISKES